MTPAEQYKINLEGLLNCFRLLDDSYFDHYWNIVKDERLYFEDVFNTLMDGTFLGTNSIRVYPKNVNSITLKMFATLFLWKYFTTDHYVRFLDKLGNKSSNRAKGNFPVDWSEFFKTKCPVLTDKFLSPSVFPKLTGKSAFNNVPYDFFAANPTKFASVISGLDDKDKLVAIKYIIENTPYGHDAWKKNLDLIGITQDYYFKYIDKILKIVDAFYKMQSHHDSQTAFERLIMLGTTFPGMISHLNSTNDGDFKNIVDTEALSQIMKVLTSERAQKQIFALIDHIQNDKDKFVVRKVLFSLTKDPRFMPDALKSIFLMKTKKD